jgi:hypothetical protein
MKQSLATILTDEEIAAELNKVPDAEKHALLPYAMSLAQLESVSSVTGCPVAVRSCRKVALGAPVKRGGLCV